MNIQYEYIEKKKQVDDSFHNASRHKTNIYYTQLYEKQYKKKRKKNIRVTFMVQRMKYTIHPSTIYSIFHSLRLHSCNSFILTFA